MDASGIDGIARSLAGARSRRSLLKGLAAGVAVVAAGKVGIGTVAASGGAEQFVIDYYDALQKHSWSKAYNLLGGAFHQDQSLDDFIAGFAETAYTSVEVGHVASASGGRYAVGVVVNAWLSDGSPQQYVGTYFVGREGGVAKIVGAELEVGDSYSLAPLCFAGQLSASAAGGSATGHRYSDITVTNNGDVCVLAGMPSVSIKDKHGSTLIKGKRAGGTSISAVPLGNGESALLSLDWTNWCGGAVSGQVKASISLPGETGHFTVGNAIGVPPCVGGGTSALAITPWQFS